DMAVCLGDSITGLLDGPHPTAGGHRLTPPLSEPPWRSGCGRRVSPVSQARFERPSGDRGRRAGRPGSTGPMPHAAGLQEIAPCAEHTTETGVRRWVLRLTLSAEMRIARLAVWAFSLVGRSSRLLCEPTRRTIMLFNPHSCRRSLASTVCRPDVSNVV